jgi:hypothetical protein
LAFGGVAARGDALAFYGGDLDNRNGLANERNTVVNDARVYDDFNLTSATSITRLFSNNLTDIVTTNGYYEIRSGVSSGNGGTLLSSGNVTISETPTGRSAFGYVEQHFETTALAPIALAAGHYWMTLVPIDSGSGRSFLSTTAGANSVGSPIANDQSFFDSAFFGANFAPASGYVSSSPADFSIGVYVAGSAVPTPMASAGGLAMLGCFAAMRVVRGRRETQSVTL